MAHVRALVRRLGGTIECVSTLDVGTTFTIRLPAVATYTQGECGLNANPVTILLIEDDPGHARLIEKNVRRAGVNNTIMPFTDGTAALEHLFGTGPDGKRRVHLPILVLLDLNLPDMSGTDILARIKEDELVRRAPVIVLTTTDDKAGDPALLRPGLQRLHHQTGRVRELRRRDPATRLVPGGDAGA